MAIYDAVMIQRLDTFEGNKGDLHVKQVDADDGTRWTPGWVRNNGCADYGYSRSMAGRSCAAGESCYEYQQTNGGVSADSGVRYNVAG
jgi:hypothetical protein